MHHVGGDAALSSNIAIDRKTAGGEAVAAVFDRRTSVKRQLEIQRGSVVGWSGFRGTKLYAEMHLVWVRV